LINSFVNLAPKYQDAAGKFANFIFQDGQTVRPDILVDGIAKLVANPELSYHIKGHALHGFNYLYSFFGKYYNTGAKYPVVYGKLIRGRLEGDYKANYFQALGALSWQKHINRIGNERLLIIGGKSWSEKALPLSRLFAANGFRFDESSLYAFGGMLSIYPYEFYTDQFINTYWKHDFDWRFYSANFSAPFLSLAHNILSGRLDNRDAHKEFRFSVPEKAYHESGLLANNLIRIKYFDVYYLTLTAGYFYHWADEFDVDKNGRFVFGFGAEF